MSVNLRKRVVLFASLSVVQGLYAQGTTNAIKWQMMLLLSIGGVIGGIIAIALLAYAYSKLGKRNARVFAFVLIAFYVIILGFVAINMSL